MANKKEGFWSSLFSDGGKISSKRLITICSFGLIAMGFIANLFWDFTIDENIFNSLQWIVMAGLGFTAAEGFSPNGGEAPAEPEPTKTTVTHEYDHSNDDI